MGWNPPAIDRLQTTSPNITIGGLFKNRDNKVLFSMAIDINRFTSLDLEFQTVRPRAND